MLVFGRENWPQHLPWCVATLAVTAAAVAGYVVYGFSSGSWNQPGGGSPPGFAYGVLGGGIILFEMLLWPRKSLWRGWRLGRTKLWMTAHIWLGLLSIPLLLLHGGFHFRLSASTLAAVLMWLLVLVVGSGVLGLVLQNILPRLMLEQVPAETIYAQIGHILEQYRDEAQRLVDQTCGQSTSAGGNRAMPAEAGVAPGSHVAVGSVRQVGRVAGQGRASEHRRPDWVAGSEALLSFYGDQVEPYLRAGSGTKMPLGRATQSRAMFQALKTRLPVAAHPAAERLADFCDQRRQFDLQGADALLAALVAGRSRGAVGRIDVAHDGLMPCLRLNISRMLVRDDRGNRQTAQVADRAWILPSDGSIHAVAALALCGRDSGGGGLACNIGNREPKRRATRMVARAQRSSPPKARWHSPMQSGIRRAPRATVVCADQWLAVGAFAVGSLGYGKQEVHGLPCRAGASQDRAERLGPGLRGVSSRPPRPRRIAADDGRLGVHRVSPESAVPSSRRCGPTRGSRGGNSFRPGPPS